METLERTSSTTAPSHHDAGVAYVDIADKIISERHLSLGKRQHNKLINQITHSLEDHDNKTDKIAALAEVIDQTKTSLHRKIGRFVTTKLFESRGVDSHITNDALAPPTNETTSSSIDKKKISPLERTKKKLKRVLGATALGVGVGAAYIFTRDPAQVHETISNAVDAIGTIHNFGGNSTGGNNYMQHITGGTHLSEGRGSTLVSAHPGDVEMGGVVPSQKVAPAISNENMANRAAELVAEKGDGSDVFAGHSQGTMAIAEYFEEHELEDDDKIVLLGGPYSPDQRLSENDLFKIVEPMADRVGIELDQELPGGENVLYVMNRNDLVGLSTNGKNNPGDILNRIVGTVAGDGHSYSADDVDGVTAHKDIINDDGSTTRIILNSNYNATDGSPIESGIGEALAKNDMPVTPEQDNFFEAIRGEEDGRWNMQEVAETGAALAEQAAPGTGEIVTDVIDTPEAQIIADTYMDVQDEVLEQAAEVVQNSPEIQQAMGDVAEVWSEVAPILPAEPAIEQGVQAVQNFVEAIPEVPVFVPEAPVFVPEVPIVVPELPQEIQTIPAVNDFTEAVNNFKIPGF